jgi:hypothetical protein
MDGEKAADAGQVMPPGLRPDAADAFHFDWWTTRERAAVWIEYRGRWRAGVIVGRGRRNAQVVITAAKAKRLTVAKPDSELRRRR